MKNILNSAIAGAGTGITFLIGDWDLAIKVLVLFMVFDYATGVLKGAVNKELSSDVGLKGIARKCVILIVLIVAVALDRLSNTGTWVFRTLVCYFYIANEGISLLENCSALGVPIPNKIKDFLVQLKNNNEEKGDNE